MKHISVCSGAGGMDLGFHWAGSTAVAMCEVDPWRRQVLAHRFPGVPIHPDLTTLDPGELPHADLLIGGTPCQDLSVAGRRAGLDGERSGLFWHYMRLRNHLGCEWAVWENVAGALSSSDGLDFASVLGAFVGADVPVPAGGWGGAGVVAGPWGGCVWRVLDAQHFGVPQRRRRVFVVGRLGGPCPPEILLEPASGRRDLAARRRARQGTASPLEDGTGTARTLSTSNQRLDADTESFVVTALVSPSADTDGGGETYGLARRVERPAVKVYNPHRTLQKDGSVIEGFKEDDIHDALHKGAGNKTPYVLTGDVGADRCAYDPQPDGRRYAACGDGVVAPVAAWIGRRIVAYEAQQQLEEAA